MTREFILLPEFEKSWKSLGLDDKDLNLLQIELVKDSEKGDLIVGTGGLRKVRIPCHDKGKSGGARVCYVDFAVYEKIYLITAYNKSQKDNLTQMERNAIRFLIKKLEDIQLERR